MATVFSRNLWPNIVRYFDLYFGFMDVIENRINSIADEAEDALISKEIEEIRRYALSNQLRTGMFGQDACVQTDDSELPNVKVLAANTAELMKEMHILKGETERKLKIINVQYETKLQQEADALYTSLNDKIKSLENFNNEKISVLRRKFQQQLSDAMQVVRASYKTSYRTKEEIELVCDDTNERVKDLLNELQEKNLMIENMNEQLKKYEITSEGVEDLEKNRLKSENEKLKDNIDLMQVKLEEIRQALEYKEQTLDLAQLKSEVENSKKALQMLKVEHEQLKMQLSLERESGKEMIKQLKEEMEKEMKCIETSHMKEKAAFEMKFEEQKLTEHTTMEVAGNTELVQELKELKKTEAEQKNEIERLKKQLCISNQVWEKKFEILRQSFHAIKDEMFLRQTLQRQEAILHNASVSFGMDAPFSPQQKSTADRSFKKLCCTSVAPLPSIGAGGQQRMDRASGNIDFSLQSKKRADALPGSGHPKMSPKGGFVQFGSLLHTKLHLNYS